MNYKLIKIYPGSAELNSTATIDEESSLKYYTHKIKSINGTTFGYINKPERYPEFWQEVVEKDYEILSYIHNGSKHIWKKDSQLKDTFCLEDGKSPFTRLEDILKYPKIYLIHSVKRLSDSQIFTIGDFDNFGKITGFVIKENKIISQYFRIGDWQWLSSIQKAKKPLFTTEDGVDIFEGDKCVTVILDKFIIGNLSWQPDLNHLAPYENKGYMKVFSTKEKAEEYIFMNKPVLSLNDIQNNSNITIGGMKSLTELVKQKLK